MRRGPGHEHADDGAAAVEFALVCGVLVLLLVGMIQFGLIFRSWLAMEHAAREGARAAALWVSDANVQSTVQAMAPGVAMTVSISRPGGQTTGQPVSVTVTHDVPVLTPVMANILGVGATKRLTASATQRIE